MNKGLGFKKIGNEIARLLTLLSLLVQALAPSISLAKQSTNGPKISYESKVEANEAMTESFFKRFGRTSSQIKKIATAKLNDPNSIVCKANNCFIKPAGKVSRPIMHIGREVMQVQATLILLIATALESKRQKERIEKLSGKTLDDKPLTTDQDTSLCAIDNPSASLNEELFCSGEFLMGLLSTAGTETGVVMTKVLSNLIKFGGKRNPFIGTILAMGTMSMHMFAATAASFLWTRAVQILETPEQQNIANGLLGRYSLTYLTSNKLNERDQTVFNQVIENMYNILIIDDANREIWISNAIRLGMARGEFLTNVGGLMASIGVGGMAEGLVLTAIASATTAAATVTASGGTAAPQAGWVAVITAATIGTIVAMALGVWVTSSLFESELPANITKLIQDMRSWSNRGSLKIYEEALWKWSFYKFSKDEQFRNENWQIGALMAEKPEDIFAEPKSKLQLDEEDFANRVQLLEEARQSYITVLVEKYYETALDVSTYESEIALAKGVITNADIRAQIYTDDNGKIRSLAELKKIKCGALAEQKRFTTRGQTVAICKTPFDFHLEEISNLENKIKEARKEFLKIPLHIVATYGYHAKLLYDLRQSKKLDIPPSLKISYQKSERKAALLRLYFSADFASLHPELDRLLNESFESSEHRSAYAAEAQRDLNIAYTHMVHEDEIANAYSQNPDLNDLGYLDILPQ